MLKLLIESILNKFKTIEPVVQEVTETKKPAVKRVAANKPANKPARKVAVKKPAVKKAK
jgi:hypothetical protein